MKKYNALVLLTILTWAFVFLLYDDSFADFRRGPRTSLSATGESGGFPQYDPAESSGSLLGWWDASDSDSITGTTSVTQWDDKSGNDNHLTILDANNGPDSTTVTQNGLSTLDFDHTNTEYISNNAFVATASSWTLVVVARLNSDTGVMLSSRSNVAGTGGSGTRWDWRAAAGNRQLRFYPNSAEATQGTTADDTIWHIHTIATQEGGSGFTRTWIDGVVEDGGSSVYPNVMTDMNVGVFNDETLPADMTIGELIIYDEIISDEARRSLESHLQNKWNTAAINNGEGYLNEDGGWFLSEDGFRYLIE